MHNIPQKTISHQISCNSVALHSGENAKITLIPAEVNSGIVFRRIDLKPTKQHENEVRADFRCVKTTNLGTTIANEFGTKVATIEHLLAAIWGCGIDNLLIEINNIEVPIMDGSSAPFVFLIESAGIKIQEEDRKIIEIMAPVRFESGDKFVEVVPSKSFKLDLSIDFNHPLLSKNNFSFCENVNSFKNDVCRARTFCFEEEIEMMQKNGLAKGGSLENAIVVAKDRILNAEKLRMPDEFIRHKALDFFGDIFLSGHQIIGHFTAHKTGHSLNNQFLHHLFNQKEAFRVV